MDSNKSNCEDECYKQEVSDISPQIEVIIVEDGAVEEDVIYLKSIINTYLTNE